MTGLVNLIMTPRTRSKQDDNEERHHHQVRSAKELMNCKRDDHVVNNYFLWTGNIDLAVASLETDCRFITDATLFLFVGIMSRDKFVFCMSKILGDDCRQVGGTRKTVVWSYWKLLSTRKHNVCQASRWNVVGKLNKQCASSMETNKD